MNDIHGGESLLISARDLVKKYDQVYALKGLSLTVERGQTIALIGPNGAGKTTTLESLLGLRQPDSGTITIFGIDVLKDPKPALERIGAHLQETRLFAKATPRDYLKLFSKIFQKAVDLDELVEWLGLGSFMDVKVAKLSGGMRQRLSLALAVINDPELVILDEPTVGLDPIARQEFWDLLRKLQRDGKTLLFSTHYMQEATELPDKIVMIHAGEVVYSGAPSVVIKKADELGGSLDSAYRYYVERASGPAQ